MSVLPLFPPPPVLGAVVQRERWYYSLTGICHSSSDKWPLAAFASASVQTIKHGDSLNMDLLSTGHWVICLGGYNAGAASFTPNEHISQGLTHTPVSSSISLGFQDGRLQLLSLALPSLLCMVTTCTGFTFLPHCWICWHQNASASVPKGQAALSPKAPKRRDHVAAFTLSSLHIFHSASPEKSRNLLWLLWLSSDFLIHLYLCCLMEA